MTSGTPFGGRPATATRDVESVEESDVDQSGCGLFAWFVNVHLLNQNSKATLRYTPFRETIENKLLNLRRWVRLAYNSPPLRFA